MKNTFQILLACSVLNTAAFAAETSEKRLITVAGKAEVKVAPDLADLNFSIEERNFDMAKAIKAESEKIAKVLAALRAAKIEDKDLQTSQMTIRPVYESNNYSESTKIIYFSVSQSVYCTTKTVNSVPEITATAITAGANSVGSVTLRTSELRKHRDAARKNALIAAREKATDMAAVLDAKIGPVTSIAEAKDYSEYGSSAYGNNFQQVSISAGSASSGETFSPGMISVSADVSVVFELK